MKGYHRRVTSAGRQPWAQGSLAEICQRNPLDPRCPMARELQSSYGGGGAGAQQVAPREEIGRSPVIVNPPEQKSSLGQALGILAPLALAGKKSVKFAPTAENIVVPPSLLPASYEGGGDYRPLPQSTSGSTTLFQQRAEGGSSVVERRLIPRRVAPRIAEEVAVPNYVPDPAGSSVASFDSYASAAIARPASYANLPYGAAGISREATVPSYFSGDSSYVTLERVIGGWRGAKQPSLLGMTSEDSFDRTETTVLRRPVERPIIDDAGLLAREPLLPTGVRSQLYRSGETLPNIPSTISRDLPSLAARDRIATVTPRFGGFDEGLIARAPLGLREAIPFESSVTPPQASVTPETYSTQAEAAAPVAEAAAPVEEAGVDAVTGANTAETLIEEAIAL